MMRISAVPLRVAAVLAACSSCAWAHPGDAHLEPGELLHAWTWDPLIICLLVIAGVLYALGVARLKSRNVKLSSWQVASYVAGWLSLVMALISPLHKLGSALFSAHMAQHEILMLIAAPLLVMGRPLVAFLWGLPLSWRERLGALSKTRAFAAAWRALTGALAVWIIHAVTLWTWHIPALYQATLHSEFVHALQHTCFLVSSLLFWWALIQGRYGRMGYGVSVLYVFTTALHSSILGALLTFAPRVWYPIYQGRTAAWNLTPVEDQQLGGLIMWIPAGTVFIIVGLALFAAWLGESDRRLAYSRSAALLGAAARERDVR